MTPLRSWTSKLRDASSPLFNTYCIVVAFGAYFCMYAFRKPFSAGVFEGQVDLPLLPPIDYKILLIISQVMGYTISKFVGIKVISELPAHRRALGILSIIGFAELALLGFGLTPAPWSLLFLFLNGLPLGMVWGMVFGFLEGRRSTELLGAGLSASYIVSSGMVKTVGRWILAEGVSETWMPFVTGLIFIPALILFVFLLNLIPPPSEEDEKMRVKREPMDRHQRKRFLLTLAPGLLALTGLYMLLTAYRDFRDNFAREIWDAVGHGGEPAIFTYSEIPSAFAVLLALALIMMVKNNRLALSVIHAVMLGGTVLMGISTLAFQLHLVGPVIWMISVGVGLYLAYVPYGCMLFDRLIACIGVTATAGFMIYVTDAFGYLGSVGLLLYKNFGQPDLDWLPFFIGLSYLTSILCSLSFCFSWGYFHRRTEKTTPY